MKFLKIIFLVFIIVIVIIVGVLFVVIKTFDINAYKSQLTDYLSETLARDVRIGQLNFTYTVDYGVTLQALGVSIGESLDSEEEYLAKIDALRFDIDVTSLISQRKIVVNMAEVDGLDIKIVKNSQGDINLATFVQNIPAAKKTTKQREKTDDIKAGKKDPQSRLAPLVVKNIVLKNGQVEYIDRSAKSQLKIRIRDISMEITDFAFNKEFPFSLSCALWSQRANIHLNGKVFFDPIQSDVKARDVQFSMDLEDISDELIESSFPALSGFLGDSLVKGKIKINIDHVHTSKQGLIKLVAQGQLLDGRMQIENYNFPLDQINMNFDATQSDIRNLFMTMNIASGKGILNGNIRDYLSQQNVRMDFELQDFPVEKIINGQRVPLKMQGQLNVTLEGQWQGLDPKRIQSTLSGNLSGEILQGRLVDINILNLVLSKLSMIPDLVAKLEAQLPDKYKRILQQKDTELKKANLQAQVQGQKIFIKNIEIDADGIILLAKGQLDINYDSIDSSDIVLEASIVIAEELSTSMIQSVEALSYLSNENNQIRIPLRTYRGKLSGLKIFPDLEYIGKKVIQNKGKDELKKAILKALDIEEMIPQRQSPDQNRPEQEEVRPEVIIIESILDQIFK